MSRISNKIIAVTTSSEQGSKDFERLTALGATVFYMPTIKTVPLDDYRLFDSAIDEIESFDYLIFTSANSIAFFSMRLSQLTRYIDYSTLQVACVGNKTAAACLHNHIPITIVPEQFSASALVDEFKRLSIRNKKILIPCSGIAREELKIELEEMENEVHSIPIYNTQMPLEDEVAEIKHILNNNKIDLIAFTSPSSFTNFMTILDSQKNKNFFDNTIIAAIGNTTKDSITEAGFNVDIVPVESSLNGLAESIIKYFN